MCVWPHLQGTAVRHLISMTRQQCRFYAVLTHRKGTFVPAFLVIPINSNELSSFPPDVQDARQTHFEDIVSNCIASAYTVILDKLLEFWVLLLVLWICLLHLLMIVLCGLKGKMARVLRGPTTMSWWVFRLHQYVYIFWQIQLSMHSSFHLYPHLLVSLSKRSHDAWRNEKHPLDWKFQPRIWQISSLQMKTIKHDSCEKAWIWCRMSNLTARQNIWPHTCLVVHAAGPCRHILCLPIQWHGGIFLQEPYWYSKTERGHLSAAETHPGSRRCANSTCKLGFVSSLACF